MQTTSRPKAWGLLVGGLFLMVPAAGVGGEVAPCVVSDQLLEYAQLTRVWQASLPMKKGESLEAMAVLGRRLYVRSSQNYAWSFDRDNGRAVFSQPLARPGFPLLGWSAYDNQLISVIDNRLVEFDQDSGLRERVSDLELSVVAPPVRNSRFYYVSAADRRLHVLRARDMVQIFEVSAWNESAISSILANEDEVVFGTDAGNLIAMKADAPTKLWQFDAAEAMAGPVVRDGRSFYFANKDTNVYRVDATGVGAATLVWRHQTEAILDRPPRVTPGAVYQYALGRGLTAIDKPSGEAIWFLPEGVDLLAETGGRAYVITKSNTLAVMDNRQGKLLYSMNLAAVIAHAANTVDGMIYIADNRGRIVCLQPVR
ncbi:MAG: PQQ-binding-like beta-propeller repeat protein [Phycisphaerales bacterium]|nr:MAG: PQQ-binding-like beta-propeller repeat protein [Phycisphaerales bacterium]